MVRFDIKWEVWNGVCFLGGVKQFLSSARRELTVLEPVERRRCILHIACFNLLVV